MYVYECSLSVLVCCYVDEVIIGVLWEVIKDMVYFFLYYVIFILFLLCCSFEV